jgi:hypothetical protein
MINQNVNANYYFTETFINNQNKPSFSLKHVFQSLFPSIKYYCTSSNSPSSQLRPLVILRRIF